MVKIAHKFLTDLLQQPAPMEGLPFRYPTVYEISGNDTGKPLSGYTLAVCSQILGSVILCSP